MLIDTHIHYNLEPLFGESNLVEMQDSQNEIRKAQQGGKKLMTTEKDGKWFKVEPTWKKHWKKAKKVGVNKSIVISTDFRSAWIGSSIVEHDAGLFLSVGLHPTEMNDSSNGSHDDNQVFFINLTNQILALHSVRIVAIGETGLDYYRLLGEDEKSKQLQRFIFEAHVRFAQQKKLPLILHVRDKTTPEVRTPGNAYWDALEILQKHNVKNFTLHCVSGPLSYVHAAIEMGGYMGFDGNITYPNARHIRDIFAIVPEDRRLLETDAPFLPPQEFRGKTCEPWMITKTAEYIVRELKVDQNSFTQNAERLFQLS